MKQTLLISSAAFAVLVLMAGPVVANEDADKDPTRHVQHENPPKDSPRAPSRESKSNDRHAEAKPQGHPADGHRPPIQARGPCSTCAARGSAANAGAVGAGRQAQANTNTVAAGNHNGNLRNVGNSASRSTAMNASTQSSTNTNTNTNSSRGNMTSTRVEGSTYIQQAPPRSPVASAIAPALANGSDTCVGSTAVGAQGLTFGASFGHQWTDDNCVMLKNATLLWNMGKQDAAVALLCGNEKMREALEMSGTACPQAAKRRVESTRARSDGGDPQIAARTTRMQQDADPFGFDANRR